MLKGFKIIEIKNFHPSNNKEDIIRLQLKAKIYLLDDDQEILDFFSENLRDIIDEIKKEYDFVDVNLQKNNTNYLIVKKAINLRHYRNYCCKYFTGLYFKEPIYQKQIDFSISYEVKTNNREYIKKYSSLCLQSIFDKIDIANKDIFIHTHIGRIIKPIPIDILKRNNCLNNLEYDHSIFFPIDYLKELINIYIPLNRGTLYNTISKYSENEKDTKRFFNIFIKLSECGLLDNIGYNIAKLINSRNREGTRLLRYLFQNIKSYEYLRKYMKEKSINSFKVTFIDCLIVI